MAPRGRLSSAFAAVVVALMAAVLAAPSAGAAPASSHDLLQPKVMRQAAALAARPSARKLSPFSAVPGLTPRAAARVADAQGPSREVFGFVNAGAIADPSTGYPSWNLSLLSTVAFFGLHVSPDGTLATNDTGWAEWNSGDLTGLVGAAHANGVRVVVSVVLQDNGQAMCSGLANGATTVQQIVAQVRQKGVDGVNIDYEGVNETCGSSTSRALLPGFVQQLRQALPAASYLTVDTYATSAADGAGFFDVGAIAPSVDALFVMAYDMDGNYSAGNWQYPPLSCGSYCFSPTSPLSGYRFNLTSTAEQYLEAVPASKVILGLPYYGYTACVAPASAARPGPNAAVPPTSATDPAPQWRSPRYLDSAGTQGTPGVANYAAGRDPHDAAGQDPYGTWTSSTYGCWRESYWDDPASLGQKYDLVNSANLRGVGIFSLDYGGGDKGLWDQLASKFAATA